MPRTISRHPKKFTIIEIASLAKVSPATISLVLNDRPGVSDQTRARVLKLIKEIGYTPNLVARSLVSRRSRSVGMMIPNARNLIFPETAEGVDSVLKKRGYSLSLISTYDDRELEAQEIENVLARGLDGIITSSALIESERLRSLVESGFPVVCAVRRIYDCPKLDYVVVDNLKGGYMAVEHLIRLGYGPIAVIRGPLNISASLERFEGARKALGDYGAPLPDHLIRPATTTIESGFSATKELLALEPRMRPRAIFAWNDDTAIGAFEALIEHGLGVPSDMALVGFNNSPITGLRTIGITTIEHRSSEIGRISATRLLNKIEGEKGYQRPYQKVLEPSLVIRNSCGMRVSGYVRERSEHRPYSD